MKQALMMLDGAGRQGSKAHGPLAGSGGRTSAATAIVDVIE